MAKSRVGEILYEKIFKHYTFKQWKKYPEELAPEVLARIPVRNSFDDRYFSDKYQVLPEKGYTAFFERILDKHKNNIDVKLSVVQPPKCPLAYWRAHKFSISISNFSALFII